MGKNIGGAKGVMAKHNFFEEVIKLIKTMKELLEKWKQQKLKFDGVITQLFVPTKDLADIQWS